MAAYAALVSLTTVIARIQQHPWPPIALNKQQVELLWEKITFLQEFLEGHSHCGTAEASSLEGRIADAAYEAEDVIECCIVNQIRRASTGNEGTLDYIDGLSQALQKVITDMDFIAKEAMDIKKQQSMLDQTYRHSIHAAGSVRSSLTGKKSDTVGLEDVSHAILDQLTRDQPNCQVMPIIGMGGIGKTTLARNVYENSLVVQHFDIRSWITVSQEYNIRELLLEALLCFSNKEDKKYLKQITEPELGIKLHKTLSGRRYLIIMDDLWSIDAWDKIRHFFPENNNGSRIVITTRLSSVAFQSSGTHGLEMNFLDESRSWKLLCKTVFGDAACPPELEEVSKKIAENCSGLPLSIVVIGGLLAKSKRTQEYWEYVGEHLSSIVNSEDNQHYLEILQVSYNQLPVHLKPCFLYMGVFPEDQQIRVSWLIKLWIAEGFLKAIRGKSLEEVAEEYLKDLIERNLILVHQKGLTGKIKFCKIHDLLRDSCLREAQKDKFLRVSYQYSCYIIKSTCTARHLAINETTWEKDNVPQLGLDDLPSTSPSLARSLICNFKGALPCVTWEVLRVLKTVDKDNNPWNIPEEITFSLEDIFLLVNSRFLAFTITESHPKIPSSIYLLWNLNTIIGEFVYATAPPEIWKMPQLRHVQFRLLFLPDPPRIDAGDNEDIVLENLETLQTVRDLNCGEEVLRRIPNVKKLKIEYDEFSKGYPNYSLYNLAHLLKLESLDFVFNLHPRRSDLAQNFSLPRSLKRLTLLGSNLHWEDLTTHVGSLPHLEVLKMRYSSFVGPHWETVEGQFCSLKFLQVGTGGDSLEQWTTENTHFPRLEHLLLIGFQTLKEFPKCIGDIPTLQSIQLSYCNESLVSSAQELIKEQQELGNEELQLQVKVREPEDD